jgi:hypothetical protein
VGGGRDACETAEWLASQGRTVVVVAPTPGLALDMGAWTRWVLLDRLEALGVEVRTNIAVDEDAATLVVHALGWATTDTLPTDLAGRVRVIEARGVPGAEDGVGESVRAGYLAARAIDAAAGLA